MDDNDVDQCVVDGAEVEILEAKLNISTSSSNDCEECEEHERKTSAASSNASSGYSSQNSNSKLRRLFVFLTDNEIISARMIFRCYQRQYDCDADTVSRNPRAERGTGFPHPRTRVANGSRSCPSGKAPTENEQ